MSRDRPFLLQSVKMYGQKRPLVRSEPPLFPSIGTSSSGDTVLESSRNGSALRSRTPDIDMAEV